MQTFHAVVQTYAGQCPFLSKDAPSPFEIRIWSKMCVWRERRETRRTVRRFCLLKGSVCRMFQRESCSGGVANRVCCISSRSSNGHYFTKRIVQTPYRVLKSSCSAISNTMPPSAAETLRAWLLSALVVHGAVAGNPDAKRLYDDLLSNYNKLVRPVVNTSDVLRVCIKLKLSQLIDVVRVLNNTKQHYELYIRQRKLLT